MTFTKSGLENESNLCEGVLCDSICLLHIGSSLSAVAHRHPIWEAEFMQ